MKIKCIYRSGSKIPDALLPLGYTPTSVFNVTCNRVYVVYGISLWKQVIHYLIVADEIDRPDWFPAAFFDVVDSRLPSNWHYSFWGDEAKAEVEAVWGYEELNDGGGHYDALMERDTAALEVFNERRKEIDEPL